jgi:hypothetical protein
MTDNCITVNYNNIREILSLILEAEVNEEHAKVIIERLNDAMSNNKEELKKIDINRIREARDPIEVPEPPMAYERGFCYGCDPTSTSDGASTPEGEPYLWNLYFHWLMNVRCENATMARFKKGFLDGVLALSINKGE